MMSSLPGLDGTNQDPLSNETLEGPCQKLCDFGRRSLKNSLDAEDF